MTVFDTWDPNKPVFLKRGEEWVQGTLVYTAGVGTSSITFTSTTTPTSRGLSWERVDFLLQHLGFWAIAYPDYVTYSYRGDNRYTASYYDKAHQPEWSDAQVREILAYAAVIIDNYERAGGAQVQPPAPASDPINEFEVEEW